MTRGDRGRGEVSPANSMPMRSVGASRQDGPLGDAALVRRSVIRLSRRLRAERPSGGLSVGKLSILGHLQPVGALTAGELAARERAQPQSLTRMLAELEQEGLVSREQDSGDRRRIIVRVTPAGSAALMRDVRKRDAWLAAAMDTVLTPVEGELLRLAASLLDRLA